MMTAQLKVSSCRVTQNHAVVGEESILIENSIDIAHNCVYYELERQTINATKQANTQTDKQTRHTGSQTDQHTTGQS